MSLTINGSSVKKIFLKQKEAKRLKITFSVSILTANISLIVKDSEGNIKIAKNDASFDKTLISSNIVRVYLTSTDLNLSVGEYDLEIKTEWNSTNSIDKSETIKLYINRSLNYVDTHKNILSGNEKQF